MNRLIATGRATLQLLRRLDARVGRHLVTGAQVIFVLIALATLVTCLTHQVRAVAFPYQLDYGEAPLADQALRLSRGQTIYRADLSEPPYTISNYPPLYVALLAVGVRLVGPEASFAVGRTLSAIAVWVASACLFVIVYSQTRSRMAGMVAAAMMVAFPYVVYWSSLMRIDSLALALSLGGLALLVTTPVSLRRVCLAAALLVAAIFTRQTYALAAPAAAATWLFAQDRRQAVVLIALVGGATCLLVLALEAWTHGGFFFNVVTANVNEFRIDTVEYHWKRLRTMAAIPLLVGAVSTVLGRRLNPLRMLAVPYLMAAVLSALTIGKVGSHVNYLLEMCAALSLSAGIVVAVVETRAPRSTAYAVLLLGLCAGCGRMIAFARGEFSHELRERRASVEQIGRLSRAVAQAPGRVLADEYMGILTQQGRPIFLQPFEMTQLARAGRWDETPFLTSIENGDYDLIILYDKPWLEGRWTPRMLEAIRRRYVVTEVVAGNEVYRRLRSASTSR